MSQSAYEHRRCKNTKAKHFKKYYDDSGTMIGLSCDGCLSEWALEHHVREEHRGSETIEISTGSFYFIDKPHVSDSTFCVRPHTHRIDDLYNLGEHLKAGDHIMYQWYMGLKHHAIVENVESSKSGPGMVTLIHWRGRLSKGNLLPNKGLVVQETVHDMREKATVIYRCDYNEGSIPEDSREFTLARARAWIGEKGYNIVMKNCEHLAVFCKIGRHWSFQGERLVKRLLRACVAAVPEVVTAVAGIAMKSVAADALGNLVEVRLVQASGASLAAMQGVGLAIVAIVQGVSLVIDYCKLRKKVDLGDMTEEEFVGRIWHKVCQRLERFFFIGVLPAGIITMGVLLPGGAVAVGVSMVLGTVCAGVLTIPWGYNGDLSVGCLLMNKLVRLFIAHRDVPVKEISDISVGDQIVRPMWVLHPRCHMIVTLVDIENRRLSVIRFTYRRGVIEETINFHTPTHKVIPEHSLDAEEVIQRARQSTLIARNYSILTFNCKHFAFLCKTGKVPLEP